MILTNSFERIKYKRIASIFLLLIYFETFLLYLLNWLKRGTKLVKAVSNGVISFLLFFKVSLFVCFFSFISLTVFIFFDFLALFLGSFS